MLCGVGPRVKPGDCAQRHSSVLACFVSLSFAGLVVLARSLNPIPSRTRPLNSSAPMVLWLKPWESRSLPGLPSTRKFLFTCHEHKTPSPFGEAAFLFVVTHQINAHPLTVPQSARGFGSVQPHFGQMPGLSSARWSGVCDEVVHPAFAHANRADRD